MPHMPTSHQSTPTGTRRVTSSVALLATLLTVVLVGLISPSAQAAPECRPGYPASVATTTHLSAPVFARVGAFVRVGVSVGSGAGTPTGAVFVRAGGTASRVKLHGGSGSAGFRARIRGTFGISASYGGNGCYKGSSASRRITVFGKGGRDSQPHFTVLSARSVHRGGHPSVSGRIVAASGRAATGRVRVRISFRGHVRFTRTVALHRGRFSVSFPSVRRVGVWTASVRGGGVSGSTTFRVRR